MAAVRCDLEDFAAEMLEPFARADQRRWGGVHLRGPLLDSGRKSVEPMAARLGEEGNRQALAHFKHSLTDMKITIFGWSTRPKK